MILTHRILFIAWQNPATRRIHPVARLLRTSDEAAWEFVYIEGARDAAASGFAPFPELRVLDRVYRSQELPPLLANRLMPLSRADRPLYLARLGLDASADIIPLLARSEGRKATDTIEVFGLPTFDAQRERYRFLFFLRGIRYVAGAEKRVARLRSGDRLGLVPDPKNEADRLAITVCGEGGDQIGWVPSTLVEDIHELERLGSPHELSVERLNDADAPIQLRLLCKLEAGAVDGYAPFSSARYRPIPAEAERIDIRPHELVG